MADFNLVWNPYEDDEEEKRRIQSMLNRNADSFNTAPPSDDYRKDIVDVDSESTFGDLWQAQIGYQYDPIIEAAHRWYKYSDDDVDVDYVPLQNMEGYEEFRSNLVGARNEEEEADIKRAIDENRNRRAVMSEFGFGANLLAGVLDPINLLAVPFAGAGFVTAGARTAGGFVARRALATGAGVGVTQAGLETARAPFDPLNTWQETAMNIGFATLAGGLIGSLVSIPAARRIDATAKTIKSTRKVAKAHEDLVVNDLEKLDIGDGTQRSQRRYGDESEETIKAGKKLIPKTLERLKAQLDEMVNDLDPTVKDRLLDEIDETGEISKATFKSLDKFTQKKIRGSFDPDFYFHGTNEKTTFRDGTDPEFDTPTYGQATLDRFIDTDGNLVIRATPDDIVGDKQIGVSLTQDLDTAISYTAEKHKDPAIRADKGGRLPETVGGDDAIVFKIKKEAIDKSRLKPEAMGEILVDGDIKIAPKDFEIIRYGKHADKGVKQDGNVGKSGLVNVRKQLNKETKDLEDLTTESNLRTIEDARNSGKDPKKLTSDNMKLVESWFTNNAFYTRFLATPYKTIVQGKYPVQVKKYMIELAMDSGVAHMVNKLGVSFGNSVYQMAAMRNGEWVKAMDDLMIIFGRSTNQGTRKILDIAGGPRGFDEWVKGINKEYVNGNKLGLSDVDKEAYEIMHQFWSTWGARLEDTGLIGNKTFFTNKTLNNERIIKDIDADLVVYQKELKEGMSDFATKIDGISRSIADLEMKFKTIGLTKKQQSTLDKLYEVLERYEVPRYNPFKTKSRIYGYKALLRKKIRMERENAEMKTQLDELSDTTQSSIMAKNEENMFARFWDREAIDANRPQLEAIFVKWYEENPSVTIFENGKWIKKDLSRDPRDIAERASSTVDTIMGIASKDSTDVDVVYYGMGKSKHFKHRAIDIPNKLVLDFIVNDPMAVMKAYTMRVAPRYEYAKKHNMASLDDVLDDIDIEMSAAGKSLDEANRVRMNYQHMYDRIVGSVMRKDPSSWDVMAVKVMRDAAQLNYLGSAGFSTLPDLSKILMEHDLPTLKGILQDIGSGDKRILMNKEEGRLAGEILDIITGSSHLRMTEELANNPFSQGFYDKYAAKGKNAFYIANLLAPATRVFKQIDSMARVHTLIDVAVRKNHNAYKAAKDGSDKMKELSQFEVTYAARYNIDDKVAKEIAELVENGTIEKTNSGLYVGNTEKWPSSMNATKESFRASLNSGILNTVLMGTPADKPIIVDGVVFIPMRVAKKLNLEEDSIVRGYHRIESPLLGMPFQFMSYSFAAMNKITIGLATDQVRNRKTAIATSMILGYLSLKIKSEFGGKGAEFAWDNMDFEDKVLRAFDQSGIASLVSDMYYQSLIISDALGGPDLGFGVFEKKGPPSTSGFDAVTAAGGAGLGITDDFLRKGVFQFLTGNTGEGGKHMIRNLPFARLWFVKGFMNDMTSDWGKGKFESEPLTMGGGGRF